MFPGASVTAEEDARREVTPLRQGRPGLAELWRSWIAVKSDEAAAGQQVGRMSAV
jgi:hypothetical protein